MLGGQQIISGIPSFGAMLALELVADRVSEKPVADAAQKLVAFCRDRALIILDCSTLGKNIPALISLTITAEQPSKGLGILEAGRKHVGV